MTEFSTFGTATNMWANLKEAKLRAMELFTSSRAKKSFVASLKGAFHKESELTFRRLVAVRPAHGKEIVVRDASITTIPTQMSHIRALMIEMGEDMGMVDCAWRLASKSRVTLQKVN